MLSQPVYFILILCIVHFTRPPVTLPPVPEFPSEPLARVPFTVILYAPNTTAETDVMQRVRSDLGVPRIFGFATEADMEAHNTMGDQLSFGLFQAPRASAVGVSFHSIVRGR